MRQRLETLRKLPTGTDALPQLCVLAIFAGLATGVVMVLFHGAIEGAAWLLRGEDSESFDNLSMEFRFLMPVAGALLLGLAWNRLPAESLRLGITHVMERLARHNGRLPWRAASRQFVGTVVALTAGLSGGREGPAVHLGAAASTWLGRLFALPDKSTRTLLACGCAAAIGASFNTPLAGVVFAMEVILMEYTIAGFLPVILAAVTATVVRRWAFGGATVFALPETGMNSLWELPYIMVAGLAVGAVAGCFIVFVKLSAGFQTWPFWVRATVAGVITGAAALATPAVLGVGYDTVNEALLGNLGWVALLVILIAKTIASAACVGVGLPVGVVGPVLVIGAVLGGLLGAIGQGLFFDQAAQPALYVMLGMAAMMAAVLQAPLAALTAVLELTANPAVILPAMLIIVVAMLTVSQVFKQRSVLLTTLLQAGVNYPPDSAVEDDAADSDGQSEQGERRTQ